MIGSNYYMISKSLGEVVFLSLIHFLPPSLICELEKEFCMAKVVCLKGAPAKQRF